MTLTQSEVELTEIDNITADRVSAVRKAANGAPFLMMKGMSDTEAAQLAEFRNIERMEKNMGEMGDCPLCAAVGTDMGGDTCPLCSGNCQMSKSVVDRVVGDLGEAPEDWEKELYGMELMLKGDFNTAERKTMADKGEAMSDGSYPIPNVKYLKKAIRAVGRGKAPHDSIRRHIIKRAKALGASNLIPASWSQNGEAKKEGMPDFAAIGAYDIGTDDDVGGISLDGTMTETPGPGSDSTTATHGVEGAPDSTATAAMTARSTSRIRKPSTAAISRA